MVSWNVFEIEHMEKHTKHKCAVHSIIKETNKSDQEIKYQNLMLPPNQWAFSPI